MMVKKLLNKLRGIGMITALAATSMVPQEELNG